MNLTDYLSLLVERNDLTRNQAKDLVLKIIEADNSDLVIAAILTALRVKGESVEEIAGFIDGMKQKMVTIDSHAGAIDIVGTGGDNASSFNISTTSAFVLAGAGVVVAKHGNRAASSKCGSADVLEALGVNINLLPRISEDILKKVGMVFYFAPLYHPAMKKVGPIRKAIGIRTIFNYLGPFLNPAQVEYSLIGVPNKQIAQKLSKVARLLDYRHLMIITSDDDMDELTTTADTYIYQVKNKTIRQFTISPEKFGFKKASKSGLAGGDIQNNAAILKSVLSGEKGVKRDTVLLNCAVGLYLAGRVKEISQGIEIAADSIDSGKALGVLKSMIKETNR